MFSSLIGSFCASCVFIGALYMLCPDGVMSKTVKYILGLCFLLSVISVAGITAEIPQIDFTLPETAADTQESLEISSAEYVISQLLSASGIDFSEITVCTDKSEDGSIIINKVIIQSREEKEKIISCLGELTKNYEVEIINE